MTRSSAPGTGISRAHSSGTRLSPIRRAATAGYSASRSSVSVKMQLTRSSADSPLRLSSSRMRSSVASRIASASLSCTVVAPRSAISRIEREVVSAPLAARAAGAAQALDLGRGQAAVLARLQALESKRAEGHPFERGDGVADGVEHPPHLTLAPLVDRDLDQVGGQPLDLGGRRPAVVELHARAQRLKRVAADRRAADLRPVDPRHLEARVRELVG